MEAIMSSWHFLLYALIVVPFVSYVQGKISAHLAKRDAYNDLVNNPHCWVGAKVSKIKEPGNSEDLCGNATIIDLKFGVVKIRLENGDIMRFTCQEWKALHPVYEKRTVK